MKRRTVDVVRVFRSPLDHRRGRLVAGTLVLGCALGRSGIGWQKWEGDGRTPAGRYRVLAAWYRPDRAPRPRTALPLRRIARNSGWCDAPAHRRYNQPVPLPFGASHEALWRDDRLYDLVLDLSYNRHPAIPGRGSAIFLHSCRPNFGPTEGCVAVARSAIGRLVERIGIQTVVRIAG